MFALSHLDTDTCIRYAELQPYRVFPIFIFTHIDQLAAASDTAFRGELDRITHQVGDNLRAIQAVRDLSQADVRAINVPVAAATGHR